ncbi:MAG: (d)CMP kinase [Clostridia bacterium]|nr:(d)CMP kinase [Clostridia bacterium]
MYQIAIDGPSGAGKSTLAKILAAKLGFIYVDTGALYRSIGLYMEMNGIDPKDADAVVAALPNITLALEYHDGSQVVLLNGENVGDRIRTPQISMYASSVSAIPAVRAFLLDTQRNIAAKNNVIMDGRDIGTVILPNANVKIFLVSSFETRARRRVKELLEKGIEASYDEVLADMIARDKNDSSRAVAPLVPAEDAVHLDNSELTLEGTVDAALAIIRGKCDL